MSELYIGLMSGTSLDGIDAALVDFDGNGVALVDFFYQPFADDIKATIHDLSQAGALISLSDYGALDTRLGRLFADAVQGLLAQAKLTKSAVKAIGSHGQTVCHFPSGDTPFSLQIGDPNIIAELTGITTVSDFRRRDMAVGGQGAPLVPAFHQQVFTRPGQHRCIVNIGGIANITVLPADASDPVLGFDTGPGNTLMDQWIQLHQHRNYDACGNWARTGTILHDWVQQLLNDGYFLAPAPKSTGKEYFSLAWLGQNSAGLSPVPPEDIQASLCQLTATSIAEAIQRFAPNTEQVFVCGGGTHNDFLLELLKGLLACPLDSSAVCGIHPDHVEAMAFAWLARQSLSHLPGNLKAVTGAARAVTLGGIYQPTTA